MIDYKRGVLQRSSCVCLYVLTVHSDSTKGWPYPTMPEFYHTNISRKFAFILMHYKTWHTYWIVKKIFTDISKISQRQSATRNKKNSKLIEQTPPCLRLSTTPGALPTVLLCHLAAPTDSFRILCNTRHRTLH